MMPLMKVISGGQTGADQGALAAARQLGLKTGGCMPKGFRTEDGPRPDLAKLYGLHEHSAFAYPPRTLANVKEADATLIFGNDNSPGCKLTARLCRELGRSCFTVPWLSGTEEPEWRWIELFRRWLDTNNVSVLNVAGNRESSQPSINEACHKFLVKAL
jgi:hypothetical protein